MSFISIYRSETKLMERHLLSQEMNPWEVKGDADGKIDYEKLQKKVCRVSSMDGQMG